MMRPAHADRLCRLDLAHIHRLDAGAEVFCLIGRVGDAQADHACLESRELDADVGQNEVDVEQLHDDGQPADDVDDGGAGQYRLQAETFMRASSSPITELSRNEAIVTSTVTNAPFRRIGRKSARFAEAWAQ
jgi:hypothetical protein